MIAMIMVVVLVTTLILVACQGGGKGLVKQYLEIILFIYYSVGIQILYIVFSILF